MRTGVAQVASPHDQRGRRLDHLEAVRAADGAGHLDIRGLECEVWS